MLLISQIAFAVIEVDKKETDFTVTYQTKEVPVTKTKFLIQHKGKAFADIDYVAVKVGNNILPPTSAKQGSTNVLNKLQAIDNDVIDLHIPLHIELPAAGTLIINANEHDPAHPLRWPIRGRFATATAEQGSFVFDGHIDEDLGALSFTSYLKPATGHPDGNVYGYARTDGQFLYIIMDVTIDNTNDKEDWAALTIITENGEQRFYADRHEETYGKSSFAYTPTVSYEHKIYEFKLPVSINSEFEFFFEYYGTAGSFADFGTMFDPPWPQGIAGGGMFVLSPSFSGTGVFLGDDVTAESGIFDTIFDGDGVPNVDLTGPTEFLDGFGEFDPFGVASSFPPSNDDGLSAVADMTEGMTPTFTLILYDVLGDASAYINIHADYDLDGTFEEQPVINFLAGPLIPGVNTVFVTFSSPIPIGAAPLARFQITATDVTFPATACDGTSAAFPPGCDVTAFSHVGEIEDYELSIAAAPAVPEFGSTALLLAALVVLGGIFAVRKIK